MPGLLLALSGAALAAGVLLPAGSYRPLYPPAPGQETVELASFRLDPRPVTQAEYLAFVTEDPRWRRGQVPSLFADLGYLAAWAQPLSLGALNPQAPVTELSWFAARAYCQARGGELPSTDQWEYAADATRVAPHGARQDPELQAQILAWYAQTGGLPGPVGQKSPNFYGIYDLFGLIWEWTLDFNSTLLAGDGREAGDAERARFCGAGAEAAQDKEDYAAFMRYAFRSSLKASSSTRNLGFRCAYSP